MKTIHCTIDKCIFEADGYTVLYCRSSEGKLPEDAVKGYSGGMALITVVGSDLPTEKDAEVEIEGSWTVTQQYGMQFKASSYVRMLPSSKDAIVKFLCKEISGISTVSAEMLFVKYGADVFEALDADFIGAITSVRRIRNRGKLEAMKEDWELKQSARRLVARLVHYGIKPQKAILVLKMFGDSAEEIILNDPYQLCRIRGFGFPTVEAIAKRSEHFNPKDPLRIKNAYFHVLKEAEKDGHLYLSRDDLLYGYNGTTGRRTGVCALLCKGGYAVSENEIRNIGNEAALCGELRITNGMVFSVENWEQEQGASEICYKMLTQDIPKPTQDIEKDIAVVEGKLQISLAAKQKKAVINAVCENISIITGGPGTGKTTTLKVILSLIKMREPESQVLLMAPTGRAAKRMEESSGAEAHTIDYMITSCTSFAEEDECSEDNEAMLEADAIIVDEMSMTSMSLFYRLVKRIPPQCRLILLGDVDQLSSVAAGNVLYELIQSGLIPVTVLDVIYRQQEDLSIVKNAQKINRGIRSLIYDENFVFVEAANVKDCQKICASIYKEQVAKMNGNTGKVAVLSPFKKTSGVSVNDLNTCLRDLVNPLEDTQEIRLGGFSVRLHDKVMNLKNKTVCACGEKETAYISNGDTGFVVGFDEEKQTVALDFDGTLVKLTADDMSNITLAYSYTIHKAQGSEIPIVIIPLMDFMFVMLKRNLLYTAVTRAKECVFVVGTKSAIQRAIGTVDAHKRNTMLALRIKALFNQVQLIEFKAKKCQESAVSADPRKGRRKTPYDEIEGQMELNLA